MIRKFQTFQSRTTAIYRLLVKAFLGTPHRVLFHLINSATSHMAEGTRLWLGVRGRDAGPR